MTMTDGLIVVAILLGPLVAVGAMRWLDRGRARRRGQLEVFRTLMATRSHPASREHVQALNRIDVEFGTADRAEAAVLDAWRRYARINVDTDLAADDWDEKRRAGLADLLMLMASVLGYELDRDHLETSSAARAPAATSADLL